VVEVDVGDDGLVGEGDVVAEELVAQVGAGVDQERLVGALVANVDREPRALDFSFASLLAGVAVAVRRWRPRGVAGPE
jgi:hypothetical protein